MYVIYVKEQQPQKNVIGSRSFQIASLQARYDLFCVKSAVKPQSTNQPIAAPMIWSSLRS